MITFITWPKTISAAFSTDYARIVGEALQDDPEDLGDTYRVGSSVITTANQTSILALHPTVTFS